MKAKKALFLTGSLTGLAAIVFAHHVPVPLSFLAGAEILTSVVFDTSSGTFGVPPYQVGGEVLPDHSQNILLSFQDGDSFSVKNEQGLVERIAVTSADFPDLGAVPMDQYLALISERSSILEAWETNNFVCLRGETGGVGSSFKLEDGQGAPLSQLTLGPGLRFGSNDLDLVVSIPADDHGDEAATHDFPGHPYLILASHTDGQFPLQGNTVPIGFDSTTRVFLQAALHGDAPGFLGLLDHDSDAAATLSAGAIQTAFGPSYPDAAYFAYVVLAPGTLNVVYVSNRFTVDFR